MSSFQKNYYVLIIALKTEEVKLKILVDELRAVEFKSHATLEMVVGDITNIEGRNGAGKSSVADMVTWCLFGTDCLGNKLDPKPIGTDTETKVELLIDVDGKKILLGRSQKKTAKFFINEVPEKATKFNSFVEELFDKNLFLSIFNPSYFSSQNWQDQRSQLLSYISEPLNKEVYAVMAQVSVKHIECELKKRSLDDTEKLHKEKFKVADKSIERANERVRTLQGQVEPVDNELDETTIKNSIDELIAEQTEIDKNRIDASKFVNQRIRLESQLESIKQQIKQQRAFVIAIKDEVLEGACGTCGQELQEEHMEVVKGKKVQRFNAARDKGNEMVSQMKAIQSQLEMLPEAIEDDGNKPDTYKQISEKIHVLYQKMELFKRADRLQKEIEVAQDEANTIKNTLLTSQSVLEAIKEFRTKRSELMVTKVKESFTTISIKLFEQLKNGEERTTFEVEMDGKPYSKLSTAEKISCGLEIVEVLSEKSGVIAPTFVDNAESILKFTKPSGQLITARVADKNFSIHSNVLDAKEEVANA